VSQHFTQELSELPVVERNDVTLVGQQMAYLVQLVRSAIQRDSANNQLREEVRAANPPLHEELAVEITALEHNVREAVWDYVETVGHLKVKALQVPKS
jgi:hypothetical protein